MCKPNRHHQARRPPPQETGPTPSTLTPPPSTLDPRPSTRPHTTHTQRKMLRIIGISRVVRIRSLIPCTRRSNPGPVSGGVRVFEPLPSTRKVALYNRSESETRYPQLWNQTQDHCRAVYVCSKPLLLHFQLWPFNHTQHTQRKLLCIIGVNPKPDTLNPTIQRRTSAGRCLLHLQLSTRNHRPVHTVHTQIP